jgi:hypothetical protein
MGCCSDLRCVFWLRLEDFGLSLKPVLEVAAVVSSASDPNLVSSRFNLAAQRQGSLRLGNSTTRATGDFAYEGAAHPRQFCARPLV